MTSPPLKLYKIHYDEITKAQIEPPFFPLNNAAGPAGWFEFHPILRFLETHDLQSDVWYGFFSPKFPEKAGLSLEEVNQLVSTNADADVALFSYSWPELVTHRNVWVQGEKFHPGLIACSEAFFASKGVATDLHAEIGTFRNSVFSNYIIAKPQFWRDWQKLARAYFDYVEGGGEMLADNRPAAHGGPADYRLKTFVQERLACWILGHGSYRIVHPDYLSQPMPYLSPDDAAAPLIRALLGIAERCKRLSERNMPGAMLAYKIARKPAVALYQRRRAAVCHGQ